MDKQEFKVKLQENATIRELLECEQLRTQLVDALAKKKEHDMYTLLNDYYGGKVAKISDDTVLRDHILESEQFKKFIIELINVIEE